MATRLTVSRMCDIGKHTRCLGTVYVYPLRDGERIVECECPVPNCGHGSELEKLRAKRGE